MSMGILSVDEPLRAAIGFLPLWNGTSGDLGRTFLTKTAPGKASPWIGLLKLPIRFLLSWSGGRARSGAGGAPGCAVIFPRLFVLPHTIIGLGLLILVPVTF